MPVNFARDFRLAIENLLSHWKVLILLKRTNICILSKTVQQFLYHTLIKFYMKLYYFAFDKILIILEKLRFLFEISPALYLHESRTLYDIAFQSWSLVSLGLILQYLK